MATQPSNTPVLEFRVALTTRDYDRLVKFYTDGLGIEPAQIWSDGQGQGRSAQGPGTGNVVDVEARAQVLHQHIEPGHDRARDQSGRNHCASDVGRDYEEHGDGPANHQRKA